MTKLSTMEGAGLVWRVVRVPSLLGLSHGPAVGVGVCFGQDQHGRASRMPTGEGIGSARTSSKPAWSKSAAN